MARRDWLLSCLLLSARYHVNMSSASRFVSQRASAVDASGIRRVFDLAAKMKNPINFSIGLPDFDVPDPAKAAAIYAIQQGHNRYTPTQGIEPLRIRLRQELAREFRTDLGEVLITSGTSGGLVLAILATVNPGDEVVFTDPYFVMYKHVLTIAGGKPVPVSSYPDFRFPSAAIEAAITPRTKLLILNSPCNPSGMVLSEAEVRSAVEIARKHNLLIVSDEIYEPFLYDVDRAKGEVYSPRSLFENTVVLRGFSKSHAMTGWRVGYAAGPAEIIQQMTKLQQYIYVCAPSSFQHAALASLDLDMSDHASAYRRKRDLAFELLSRKFEVVKPGGAFYIFPQAPRGITATEFCLKAVEKQVLVIPGSVFSELDTHFRISYAVTDDQLRAGCELLCSLT